MKINYNKLIELEKESFASTSQGDYKLDSFNIIMGMLYKYIEMPVIEDSPSKKETKKFLEDSLKGLKLLED
jgi:hypothetical protein